MILGVLVLVTAIYETTRGRQRTLMPSRFTLRARLMFGLQAGGSLLRDVYSLDFLVMSILGGVSNPEDAACKPTWREIAIVLAGLALVFVCGMLWGQSSRETSEGRGTQQAGAV